MEPEGGMNDSPVMLAEAAGTVTNPTMSAAGDTNAPTASAASDKPVEKKRALGRGLESLIPAARTVPSAPPAAGGYAAGSASMAPGQTGAPANGAGEAAVAATGVTIAAMADPAPERQGGETVYQVRLEEIEASPYQPRKHKSEAALAELAQSIRATGVLQPIVLRYLSPGSRGDSAIKYQLIAGERRWLASQRAGKETVPAIIRHVSNEQAMEIALVENLQREDLDVLEMALAFERLGREFHLTQDEMAARTGKDRTTISNYLRLLRLPADVQVAMAHHKLTFGHAKALMSLEDAEQISKAAQRIILEDLSVRATEQLVNHLIYMGPALEKKDEKPKIAVDPNVRAAEIHLQRKLGVRVRIRDRRGKGKVVLEYRSLEDFDRIMEALGK